MPSKKAAGPATKKAGLPKSSAKPTIDDSEKIDTKGFVPRSKKRKSKHGGDGVNINVVKQHRSISKSIAPGPTKVICKASANLQAASRKKPKRKPIINKAPTERLDVYVFGAGEMGELGLGRAKSQDKVKRPRLNPLLAADKVGVVALQVGGMHTAALTYDNRILTWGVNDEGALGRDTDEVDDDDLDPESGLNFKESTPSEIDSYGLPEDIVWTQLTCTDNATFALTDDGDVYGWGTFRGNEGRMGFDASHENQRRPVQVPRLHNIIQLAAGSNHVLALSNKGEVSAWGAGQQNQLGRRIIERRKLNSLTPTRVGLAKKMTLIGAGAYHSFAVHENGDVYSWGLNSFGETGIALQIGDGGESDVHHATVVESLRKFGRIICIDGGSHHTVAVTNKGELLVWGRLDGFQLGLQLSSLPEKDLIRDSANRARILKVPTQIPYIDAVCASAGSDHCIAIAKNGNAHAWGFNENYQTGLGTNKDVELATQINDLARDNDLHKMVSNDDEVSDVSNEDIGLTTTNSQFDGDGIMGEKLIWAGCSAQFSILAGLGRVNAHA